jgi:hypothetical protein
MVQFLSSLSIDFLRIEIYIFVRTSKKIAANYEIKMNLPKDIILKMFVHINIFF